MTGSSVWSGESPRAPGRPDARPCRLILAVGDGSTSLELGVFGVTDGDLAGQIAKILSERRAEAARAAAAKGAPKIPGRAPPPSAAKDQNQMVALARMLADERRLILDALGQGAGDGQSLRAGARQLDLSMRRWRSFAMTEEIRGLAMMSDRVKAHAVAIADLFDADFYKSLYADFVSDIDNPLLHYVLIGWRAGLRPHPLLDVLFYRRQMGAAQGDPLLHYIQQGAAAGLDPYPLFDTDFYRATFMSYAEEETNPLLHYLTIGGAARFDPSPLFNTEAFLASLPDADAILNPLEHFVRHRRLHDFAVIPAFDPRLYRYQIETERGEALIDPPIAHYLGHGCLDETILPNLFLDPAFYRTRNEIDLHEPALVHYLREGDAGGFATHPFFSTKVYNEERGDDYDGTSAIEHAMKSPSTMLRSDRRMKTPLDPRLLAFFDELTGPCRDDFDREFYRGVHRDLEGLDDDELDAHWRQQRRSAEGRFGSPVVADESGGHEDPRHSAWLFRRDYVALNPDLRLYERRFPRGFLSFRDHRPERARPHVRPLAVLLRRHPTSSCRRTPRPCAIAPPQERIDVCVLIHAFYPDIWRELAAFAQNFRNRSVDIFINLVDLSWTPELHEEIRGIGPGRLPAIVQRFRARHRRLHPPARQCRYRPLRPVRLHAHQEEPAYRDRARRPLAAHPAARHRRQPRGRR